MKRKMIRILSMLMASLVLAVMFPAKNRAEAVQNEEFRAVWVATVLNLDYPSKAGVSVEQLKKEADSILDNALSLGYNAVILQVRPAADAFYKSSIFPWSSFLSSKQGTAPSGGFDPLAYWVEQSHERGLQLHAWINPFRVTTGKQQTTASLAASNPAKLHPEWTVAHSDGKLYLNPGIPEVRQLVIDGVVEIVKNYDIDGIQFDDYFYPGSDFKDDAAFKTYGNGYSKREDWRRDNINTLIRDTYNAVHSEKKGVVFGVSPFGIWSNKSTSQLGSDTRGSESYVTQYADTRKWVKNNWLDYIAPQLYWHIGYSVADYSKLLSWWADVVSGTNVKLYVGTAIYRAGESTKADSAWNGAEEIARQAELNKKYAAVSGVIHFRYNFLNSNKDLRAVVARVFGSGTASQAAPVPQAIPPELKLPSFTPNMLSVGRPTSSSITTSETAYYILGTCDPGKKLFANGKEVADRSYDGFFGYYAPLSNGANKITFTQEGQKSVAVTITKKTPSKTAAPKMGSVEIVAGSVFPKSANEYRKPGETVTLSCTAPIGANVKVAVDGKSYDMTPASKTAPGSGAYPTTYTYKYTFPSTSAAGKLVTIGTPKYTMTYGGKNYSRSAGGALVSITPGTPFYATVTAGNAYVYPNGTTTGGPVYELVKGQKDFVTAIAGNGAWVRLSVGGWVQAGDVTIKSETSAIKSDIKSAAYTTGTAADKVSFKTQSLSASSATFDGKTLVMTVSGSNAAPMVVLPKGGLVTSVTSAVKDGNAVYTFGGASIDGYYLTAEGDTLILNLKRRPKTTAGAKPLNGISIMLDPGHGGSDTGAIGPLGAKLAEKHMNLYLALKLKTDLENKGAKVYLTRSDDSQPSLNERVEKSRAVRPDMFISLHTNSVAESTNSSKVTGFETYYRNVVGKGISDLTLATVKADSVYGNRRSNQANFYVIRPTWTPSMLIETGFICNVSDFSRLASDSQQYKLADLLSAAVIKYFS